MSASQRITSGQAPSAASFQTPWCGPGRYRCSGVPARRSELILRPYTSVTLPSGSITGITSEPLKCSWPDSRRMPNRCSRVRISSPARRVFSGSRSPSVRLAKPSWKRSISSDDRSPRASRYRSASGDSWRVEW